jgi:class 3 adenylate cyclase
VLKRMMEAVHQYEGTVNQVLGDGMMALFGAPIAHKDHAVRACYAALAVQEAIRRYSEAARHAHGITVQIRVGLNSGEVVVRAIGNHLHMEWPFNPHWQRRLTSHALQAKICDRARVGATCSSITCRSAEQAFWKLN